MTILTCAVDHDNDGKSGRSESKQQHRIFQLNPIMLVGYWTWIPRISIFSIARPEMLRRRSSGRSYYYGHDAISCHTICCNPGLKNMKLFELSFRI